MGGLLRVQTTRNGALLLQEDEKHAELNFGDVVVRLVLDPILLEALGSIESADDGRLALVYGVQPAGLVQALIDLRQRQIAVACRGNQHSERHNKRAENEHMCVQRGGTVRVKLLEQCRPLRLCFGGLMCAQSQPRARVRAGARAGTGALVQARAR
jgi:hypothetical protein